MKGRRKGGWKRGKKRENINKGKNYEKNLKDLFSPDLYGNY